MSSDDDNMSLLSASSASSSSRPSTPMIRDVEEQRQITEILQGLDTSLPFTPNALKVVSKRYLRRTPEGKPLETPEQMFRRVAIALTEPEVDWMNEEERSQLADEFYDVMASFKFTPAGRTLANAGAGTRVVANCIVLHIEDSMKDIFQTLSDAAVLQQSGSGLGFPLHLMRPAGQLTVTSKGTASGPISFLHIFNTAFGVIKQDNRNGANMGVMRVDHPDIIEFIHCKDREGDLPNFNVSVGLTDAFMQQVNDDSKTPWMCQFNGKECLPRKITRDSNFNILNIEPVIITARQLFMQIVDSAWKTGEPGCVFLDTVNAANPLPGLGRIESCNPCGEQFLHDGDVCNLGSLFLERFVNPDGSINLSELARVVQLAVRMLDNVVDISDFPVQRVAETARNNRRVGLGIMGFADMLFKMRVGYNTPEGRDVARLVMRTIQEAAEQASEDLGRQKGVFANWDKSVFAERGVVRRNAALTNIAPTGTIAMMFDASGGVEPYFALAYNYQNVLGGNVELRYFNKHLREALLEVNCYTPEILDEIAKKGTLQHIEAIPDSVKRVFVTSMDISAEDHIAMQSAMQETCDNAISKTINFPHSATREEILQGYLAAWKGGCKGCTVYRDGSRDLQVLNLNDSDSLAVDEKETPKKGGLKDSIGSTLTSFLSSSTLTLKKQKSTSCPDCSQPLLFQEGCSSCYSCGYSACSRS